MPIASFSSFTDGLARDQRSRDHFISNINLEDDRLWVPYHGRCLVPTLPL